MAHGQIRHIEFPADDTERAQRFYSELLGWQFEGMDGFDGYFLFSTGSTERAGGAVGQRGESTGDALRIYIDVDSLDETLPKVAPLGGTVTTPKTEIPGQGWYAVITDSEGTEVGLYENLPSA